MNARLKLMVIYKIGIFLFRQIIKPQTSQRVKKDDNLYFVHLLYFAINMIFVSSLHITRKSDFKNELFSVHYLISSPLATKPQYYWVERIDLL